MGDFSLFKKQIEKDGDIKLTNAGLLKNPKPNKTGSYALNHALSVPCPEGLIVEIYGEEGTRKTTLALEIAGQALLAGKRVLYMNMERNLTRSLLQTIRTLRPFLDKIVDQIETGQSDEQCPFLLGTTFTGEKALQSMRMFAELSQNGVAILDSIDAAQPGAVLSGEIGEQKMGNHAKLMSDAMHKLIATASDNNVTLIFINQVRDKLTMYGDPVTTPGGKAVKFYASQRIKLLKPRKEDNVADDDGKPLYSKIRFDVVKNKLAPDGISGDFPVIVNHGIFRELELIKLCCDFGILEMGGKGGKQVYLPIFNKDTNDFLIENDERKTTCMSQLNAAKRLLMDIDLMQLLDSQLLKFFTEGTNQINTNEISDTE